MCEPVTAFALSAGIGAAQEGVSFIEQSRNADRLDRHQRRLHDRNEAVANENAVQAFIQTSRREVAERERAAEAIRSVTQEARLAAGSAVASAAASGVAGNSLAVLLSDFENQELEHNTSVRRNLELTEQQIEEEKRGISARRQGQIESTLPQPVPRPNLLGTALRIGGHAFNSFQDFTFIGPDGNRSFGRPSSLGGN